MASKNIELIRQALGAAESSIKLAKQLLSEMESGSGGKVVVPSGNSATSSAADLPGVLGVFDGENMVSESGESFPVPANYASKSMLVVGDTLKLVEEGKNKEKRFKQIEHVKRHKSIGILTKKDGKWKVVTPEGSYKVLGAAVEHFGADIGTEVTLHLPANNLTVAYGAIESAKGQDKKAEPKQEVSTPAEVKEEEVKEKAPNQELAPKQPKIEEPKKKETVAKKAPVATQEAPKPKKVEEPKKEESLTSSATPNVIKPAEVKQPSVEAVPATSPSVPKPVNAMEVSPEEDELT